MANTSFPGLPELAQHLRTELEQKKFVLLYACNGTGKTRLSVAFKDQGKTFVVRAGGHDEREQSHLQESAARLPQELSVQPNSFRRQRSRG